MTSKVVLSFMLVLFLGQIPCAHAGKMELTTYYPPPYGEYKQLKAKGIDASNGTLALQASGSDATKGLVVTNANNVGIGTIAPSSPLHLVYNAHPQTPYTTDGYPAGILIRNNYTSNPYAAVMRLQTTATDYWDIQTTSGESTTNSFQLRPSGSVNSSFTLDPTYGDYIVGDYTTMPRPAFEARRRTPHACGLYNACYGPDEIKIGGLSIDRVHYNDAPTPTSASVWDRIGTFSGSYFGGYIAFGFYPSGVGSVSNAVVITDSVNGWEGHPPGLDYGKALILIRPNLFDNTGIITLHAGTINELVTPTITSDINLKKNILPLSDVLDKLDRLRGVYFEWKNDRQPGRQIGVVAQEVEKEFPELVKTGQDGMKSVAYDMFAPILIEAVKELQVKQDSEIRELRSKYDADIQELRKEIHALKKRQ